MNRSTTSANYGRIAFSEGFGTAVLMLGGPGVAILAGGSALTVALTGGLTLAILLYLLGPISGAHVNPAVTLAMLLAKKINLRWAVTAWVSQFVGGIVGAAMIWGIGRGRPGFSRGNFASNGYRRIAGDVVFSKLGGALVIEVLLTALLVVVYLFAARRHFAPSMVGVVGGATLTLGWILSSTIDGGSMNPARSLGTAIFADTSPSAIGQVWAFILFPLVGAVVGVVLWLMLDDARLEDTMLINVPGADDVRDAAASIDRAVD